MMKFRLPTSISGISTLPTKHVSLLTFLVSILLSGLAHIGSTLNRDGMLYVRTAQAFLDGGFSAARELFNWPFLPIVMAMVSRITGLELDVSGHLINAIFMAGACSLMVACIARRNPENAWIAALIVLAIPGLNEYRHEILREFGYWFFVMLCFWLALRWEENPRWSGALAIQSALGAAALFRSEAIALLPALLAWQLFAAPKTERLRRLFMLGSLPLLVGLAIGAAYLANGLSASNRLVGDVGRISLARFDAKAATLASALIEYARDQARAILFFGSLSIIPIKLFQKFGIFLVPFSYAIFSGSWRTSLSRFPIFGWGSLLNLLVLAIFVVDLQFLAGRYVGLILLFSTPLLVSGFAELLADRQRIRALAIGILLVTMLANVISTGQGKMHHVQAGKWLAANVQKSSDVYIDAGRTAYFAKWHEVKLHPRGDRKEIQASVAANRYRLYVLEISRKDSPIGDWLEGSGLRVIQQFGVKNLDSVIIAEPIKKRGDSGEDM